MIEKFAKNNDKALQLVTIIGVCAAGLATFGIMSLPLVELIGVVTGSMLLGNKLKHRDLSLQNDLELKHTFKNSLFIALSGVIAHVIVQILPFTHLWDYMTSIIVVTGVSGMIIAKMQEYKNKPKV